MRTGWSWYVDRDERVVLVPFLAVKCKDAIRTIEPQFVALLRHNRHVTQRRERAPAEAITDLVVGAPEFATAARWLEHTLRWLQAWVCFRLALFPVFGIRLIGAVVSILAVVHHIQRARITDPDHVAVLVDLERCWRDARQRRICHIGIRRRRWAGFLAAEWCSERRLPGRDQHGKRHCQ